MTRYQSDVLWLGLILVALNVAINWSQIKSVIFSSPSIGGSSGSGPSIQLPGLGPFAPTIPLSTTPAKAQTGTVLV